MKKKDRRELGKYSKWLSERNDSQGVGPLPPPPLQHQHHHLRMVGDILPQGTIIHTCHLDTGQAEVGES